MFLVQVDRTAHDVASFRSGVQACDDFLIAQSRKPKKKIFVLPKGRMVRGFVGYRRADTPASPAIRPSAHIEYLARDHVNGRGLGLELALGALAQISSDSEMKDVKGVLIDVLKDGDAATQERRWSFFIDKVGFDPLEDPQTPYGYAYMSMETVHAILSLTGP